MVMTGLRSRYHATLTNLRTVPSCPSIQVIDISDPFFCVVSASATTVLEHKMSTLTAATRTSTVDRVTSLAEQSPVLSTFRLLPAVKKTPLYPGPRRTSYPTQKSWRYVTFFKSVITCLRSRGYTGMKPS